MPVKVVGPIQCLHIVDLLAGTVYKKKTKAVGPIQCLHIVHAGPAVQRVRRATKRCWQTRLCNEALLADEAE